MRTAALAILAAFALVAAACSSSTSTPAPPPESTSTMAPATTTSTTSSPSSAVLVAFPDPASTEGWINVDDSVMGGVSASESSWFAIGSSGALLFTGILSTESNGGFASTLGPADVTIGERAAGSTALRVQAQGDGRTYLLQLRAGRNGNERWIARFTPPSAPANSQTTDASVTVPIASFEAVDRFLRPLNSSDQLDPSTIVQLGIYVLDAQVGEFRLLLQSVDAVR